MIVGLIIILAVLIGLYALMTGSFKFGRPVHHKVRSHSRPHHLPSMDKNQIADQWERIELSATQGEHGLKSAIADADKLLDHVMKQAGYAGETMADRLKKAEANFTDKEAVWQAHKLRNVLAHEVNYDLVMSQGQHAIVNFRRGLKDLGAL